MELAVEAFYARLGVVHFLGALQGIGQPRCGLSLALLERPFLLPVGDVARLALFPFENDHTRERPLGPCGPRRVSGLAVRRGRAPVSERAPLTMHLVWLQA